MTSIAAITSAVRSSMAPATAGSYAWPLRDFNADRTRAMPPARSKTSASRAIRTIWPEIGMLLREKPFGAPSPSHLTASSPRERWTAAGSSRRSARCVAISQWARAESPARGRAPGSLAKSWIRRTAPCPAPIFSSSRPISTGEPPTTRAEARRDAMSSPPNISASS